jgi:hypothetical protein
MKRPHFLEGVVVALTASVGGGVLYGVISTLFPGGGVLRLLIAALGLGYILYLLRRSPERVGRITVPAAWLGMAVVTWFSAAPLAIYVLVHLGAVWLIRSLYFYSSVLSALADLCLSGLGLAVAVWALLQTGSVFTGLWCFFLVQALFVAIPATLPRRPGSQPQHPDEEDRFQHAHRVAEAAVRKLSSTQ